MKLARFGLAGQEKPGVVIQGKLYDVSSFGEDFGEKFFELDGMNRLKIWVEKNLSKLPEVTGLVRYGTPFTRPSKIICIGLNYSDHAKETGAQVPPEPVIFFKATSANTGPTDN
jgi:2-keto-4-pentenoate hydratase/2-oxohepta-3-ene-1,7-dioic acid hydratase in catechol pathway